MRGKNGHGGLPVYVALSLLPAMVMDRLAGLVKQDVPVWSVILHDTVRKMKLSGMKKTTPVKVVGCSEEDERVTRWRDCALTHDYYKYSQFCPMLWLSHRGDRRYNRLRPSSGASVWLYFQTVKGYGHGRQLFHVTSYLRLTEPSQPRRVIS